MPTTPVPDRPLAGWQVLVTRPAGDAGDLAARLSLLGAHVTPAPLLVIDPLPEGGNEAGIVADLDRVDILILTSRNAVRHGMPRLAGRWPQWPAGQQWFAIGRATADELAAFGVCAEFPADERSEGLLALPALAGVAGRRVLLITGEGGRGLIDRTLRARGAHIDRMNVYRRRANPSAAPVISGFLQHKEQRAVLVTSGEALHNLLALAPALAHDGTWLVVPVERLAEAAHAAGARHVLVAGRADDESMLATLVDMAIRSSREERT